MSAKLPESIVIYAESVFGRLYLCDDGSLCSLRSEASVHWAFQFDALVAENWILTCADRKVGFEVVPCDRVKFVTVS